MAWTVQSPYVFGWSMVEGPYEYIGAMADTDSALASVGMEHLFSSSLNCVAQLINVGPPPDNPYSGVPTLIIIIKIIY